MACLPPGLHRSRGGAGHRPRRSGHRARRRWSACGCGWPPAAGMALSFGLFLTVSFHSAPYFTGSDIVFFFAWTPLALAGAAGAPALDTWLARASEHRRAAYREPSPVGTVLSRGRWPAWWPRPSSCVGWARRRCRSAGRRHLRPPAGVRTPSAPGRATTTTAPSPSTTGAAGTTTTAAPSGTAIGTGGERAGRGVGRLHRSAAPGTRLWSSSRPPATSSPSMPSAPMPGARWPTRPRPGSSPARATGRSSTPGPVRSIRGPATTGLTPIKITKGANGDLYVPE